MSGNTIGFRQILVGAALCGVSFAVALQAWQDRATLQSTWSSAETVTGTVLGSNQTNRVGRTQIPLVAYTISLQDGRSCQVQVPGSVRFADGSFRVIQHDGRTHCQPVTHPRPDLLELFGQWNLWRWLLLAAGVLLPLAVGLLLIADGYLGEEDG